MFGCFVDDLKFFYQLKSQEYKYIYDEVGTHDIAEYLCGLYMCMVINLLNYNS